MKFILLTVSMGPGFDSRRTQIFFWAFSIFLFFLPFSRLRSPTSCGAFCLVSRFFLDFLKLFLHNFLGVGGGHSVSCFLYPSLPSSWPTSCSFISRNRYHYRPKVRKLTCTLFTPPFHDARTVYKLQDARLRGENVWPRTSVDLYMQDYTRRVRHVDITILELRPH